MEPSVDMTVCEVRLYVTYAIDSHSGVRKPSSHGVNHHNFALRSYQVRQGVEGGAHVVPESYVLIHIRPAQVALPPLGYMDRVHGHCRFQAVVLTFTISVSQNLDFSCKQSCCQVHLEL